MSANKSTIMDLESKRTTADKSPFVISPPMCEATTSLPVESHGFGRHSGTPTLSALGNCTEKDQDVDFDTNLDSVSAPESPRKTSCYPFVSTTGSGDDVFQLDINEYLNCNGLEARNAVSVQESEILLTSGLQEYNDLSWDILESIPNDGPRDSGGSTALNCSKEGNLVDLDDNKAKRRFIWSRELQSKFMAAVTQLGGPQKATPKSVKALMGIEGLTLSHVKSHLQKFRLGKLPNYDGIFEDVNDINIPQAQPSASAEDKELKSTSAAFSEDLTKKIQEALVKRQSAAMAFLEVRGSFVQYLIKVRQMYDTAMAENREGSSSREAVSPNTSDLLKNPQYLHSLLSNYIPLLFPWFLREVAGQKTSGIKTDNGVPYLKLMQDMQDHINLMLSIMTKASTATALPNQNPKPDISGNQQQSVAMAATRQPSGEQVQAQEKSRSSHDLSLPASGQQAQMMPSFGSHLPPVFQSLPGSFPIGYFHGQPQMQLMFSGMQMNPPDMTMPLFFNPSSHPIQGIQQPQMVGCNGVQSATAASCAATVTGTIPNGGSCLSSPAPDNATVTDLNPKRLPDGRRVDNADVNLKRGPNSINGALDPHSDHGDKGSTNVREKKLQKCSGKEFLQDEERNNFLTRLADDFQCHGWEDPLAATPKIITSDGISHPDC